MISALALAAALLLPVAAAPSDDPNALLKQITSGDRVATDRAVARLAHLGAGASIGRALGELLGNPQTSVRESAAYALAGLPGAAKGAEEALVKALTDDSPRVRADAARAIGRAKLRGAAKGIVKAMKDDAKPVRIAALQALTVIGDGKDKATIAAVLGGLEWTDLELVGAAMDAAGALKMKAAREPLLAHLATGPELTRPAAARALVRIGAPEGRAKLEELLSGDETTRVEAAKLLEGATETWAIDRLRVLLTDPSLKVRAAAARALVAGGDQLAVSFLVVGAETSPNPDEALAYARVLDDLGVSPEARAQARAEHLRRKP